MAQKENYQYSLSSGEETESSDEVFVFSRKRKAHRFFIDLTDGENASKKSKKEVGEESKNGDTTSPASPEENIEKHSLPNDRDEEIHFVKFVPGQPASEVSEVKIQEESGIDSCQVVEVKGPILCSPPCVFRVTGANYFKSSDVIDLTKGQEKQEPLPTSPDPHPSPKESLAADSPDRSAGSEEMNLQIDCSPVPQNQLQDKKAAEIFDVIWYGKMILTYATCYLADLALLCVVIVNFNLT